VERALRAAALGSAAKVLEQLLETVGVGRRSEPVVCPCGVLMKSVGVRAKRIQTLLGWIGFRRSAYVCPHCGKRRYPGDEELDVLGLCRSPGVRRQVSRLAGKQTFQQVSEDLAELADIRICRKEVERIAEGEGHAMEAWMAQERQALRHQEPPPHETPKIIETLYIELDGTGIPMTPGELEGRKGKQPDGTAKTREAKVGCVFTQTLLDEDAKPIRDPASTTFVSAIEQAAPFGWRLYAEAVRRGLFYAKRVVVLGDGAEWVKNIAQTHFGTAQFILDYYHASEHVGHLCRALFDRDLKRLDEYRERWTQALWDGKPEILIEQANALLPKDPNAKKDARTQVGYFDKNKRHMQYAQYRQEHLFIGSGVIEAACKNLVGSRLKQSAMQWTTRGANDILALRSVSLSNRIEDYWEQRAAA
jgi:hypothetical protein